MTWLPYRTLLLINAVLVLLTGQVTAIVPDTTHVYSYNMAGGKQIEVRDTALSFFQLYDPVYPKTAFYQSLGNTGLPYRSLLMEQELTSGFRPYTGSMGAYGFRSSTVHFFNVFRPFAEATYVSGSGKEQLFDFLYTQNLRRNLNAALQYNIINAPGQFYRQKSDHANAALTLNYRSDKQTYGLDMAVISNRGKVMENGGLNIESPFEEDFMLSQASHLGKQGEIMVDQYVRLSKNNRANDTVSVKRPSVTLGHTLLLGRSFRLFETPVDTTYFPAVFIDSIFTRDSTMLLTLGNEFYLTNGGANDSSKMHYRLGVRNKIIQFYDNRQKFNDVSFIPYGDVRFLLPGNIRLTGYGDLVAGGYNSGDFLVKGQLQLALGRQETGNHLVEATVINRYATCDYFYNYYYANHYSWANQFDRQNRFSLGVSYLYHSLRFSAEQFIYDNLVYLDNTSLPAQASTWTFRRLSLAKHFQLKRLHFYNRLVYNFIDEKEIVRLPSLMSYHSLFGQFTLFEKALTVQAGADLIYHGAYYASHYNPALQQFYLNDTDPVDESLNVDFFMNFRIKRARIFVKYHHLNALQEEGFLYQTPLYPLQGAALKFGVSWRFFD